VDEAVLVKPAVFLKALGPMARKRPNAMFMISSIMTDSFLSLLKGGDFNRINYMEIVEKCAKCRKSKTTNLCPHVRGYQSSTFSESRSEVLAELYRLCRAEDTMNEEMFSITSEGKNKRFNADDVDRFIIGSEEDEAVPKIPDQFPVIVSADLTGCGESDQVYCAVGIDVHNRPNVSCFFCFCFFSFFTFFSLAPLHWTLRNRN
jgi:hypothetical protein